MCRVCHVGFGCCTGCDRRSGGVRASIRLTVHSAGLGNVGLVARTRGASVRHRIRAAGVRRPTDACGADRGRRHASADLATEPIVPSLLRCAHPRSRSRHRKVDGCVEPSQTRSDASHHEGTGGAEKLRSASRESLTYQFGPSADANQFSCAGWRPEIIWAKYVDQVHTNGPLMCVRPAPFADVETNLARFQAAVTTSY